MIEAMRMLGVTAAVLGLAACSTPMPGAGNRQAEYPTRDALRAAYEAEKRRCGVPPSLLVQMRDGRVVVDSRATHPRFGVEALDLIFEDPGVRWVRVLIGTNCHPKPLLAPVNKPGRAPQMRDA